MSPRGLAGLLAFVALSAGAACSPPSRSPPCDVATFLCLNAPCADGGPSSPTNCPRLEVECATARDACAAPATVEACLARLAGPTLTCLDADACFTSNGCAYVGLRAKDGG